jgi:formylglycine-generating enzyme required for sulfatase activity
MRLHITILVVILSIGCFGLPGFAACPAADITRDCRVGFEDIDALVAEWLNDCNAPNGWCGGADITQNGTVDLSDFAVSAGQWLTEGIPAEPGVMAWVHINEPGFTGYMSKYETTNAQYAEYLNFAKATGDITVSGNDAIGAHGSNGGPDYAGSLYYDGDGAGSNVNGATNGGAARIKYSGGAFSVVDPNFKNHPVTFVTGYGATAFCSYYGFRLPTEGEWQAVADFDGTFNYACGATITTSLANYWGSIHPKGTTVVGAFGTYGYGMCDMSGNVHEWTSSVQSIYRVLRGGGWAHVYTYCGVSFRDTVVPYTTGNFVGFRACY